MKITSVYAAPATDLPAAPADRVETAWPADHWQAGRSTFGGHMQEAVSVNLQRSRYYAAVTGNRSIPLSLALCAFETVSRPLANRLDQRAKPFQAQGIPVVSGDFVPMDHLPPASRPTSYRKRATQAQQTQLGGWLKQYQRDLKDLLATGQFHAIAQRSHALLDKLDRLEAESQSHFAMTKHLVESLGFAALHAHLNQQASRGQVDGLSADLIRTQMMGLGLATGIDARAQRFHQDGHGIVVNDVPAIPFREEWLKVQPTGVAE